MMEANSHLPKMKLCNPASIKCHEGINQKYGEKLTSQKALKTETEYGWIKTNDVFTRDT